MMIVEICCGERVQMVEARAESTGTSGRWFSAKVPLELAIYAKNSGHEVCCVPPKGAIATPYMFMDRAGPFYGKEPITRDDPYAVWFDIVQR